MSRHNSTRKGILPHLPSDRNASSDNVLITTDEDVDSHGQGLSDSDSSVHSVSHDTSAGTNSLAGPKSRATIGPPQFKIPHYSAPLGMAAKPRMLPEFKKRPLSDTPYVSKHNSPELSPSNGAAVMTPMLLVSESDERLSSPSPSPNHSNDSDDDSTGPVSRPSFTIKNTTQQPKRRATTLDVPGLTKSRSSPDGTIASQDVGSKLVIVMVGLPARGKSYITNKLARYLNWSQHECKVFNVGNTRRKTDFNNLGPLSEPLPDIPSGNTSKTGSTLNVNKLDSTTHEASFFNPENKSNAALREQWAIDTLDELLDYVLRGPGSVGIFDATNTTRLRRQRIINRINQASQSQLKILFLESVCDDSALIEQNIRLKLSGPDYRNMDPDKAIADFTERLHNYEKVYETIGEYEEHRYRDIQYVKMVNVGRKIISYNIQGFLASQTIYFLLNFNLKERMIILTRHGESIDNVDGKIGGDCDLTKRGVKFSKTLARFITYQKRRFREWQIQEFNNKLKIEYQKRSYNPTDKSLPRVVLDDFQDTQIDTPIHDEPQDEKPPEEPTFCVWTSMLKRAVQTAQFFNDNEYFVKQMRMLNELGAGKMEGMTYKEIQEKYPTEFAARVNNKLSYRYPGLGGELYLDVINRLKPIITEIERLEDHLLLITHRVVSRILLGYFLNISKEHIGDLDIPLHSLYILEPKTYGVDWSLYEYNEERDWFFKVDKFKYTRKLKEVNISNLGKRKYSVVPSVPRMHEKAAAVREKALDLKRHFVGAAAEHGITENLNRLRNLPVHKGEHHIEGENKSLSREINQDSATNQFTKDNSTKYNDENENQRFHMDQLTERLNDIQRARIFHKGK